METIKIVSDSGEGEAITIQAKARVLSMKLLAEIEEIRQAYTDFDEIAAMVKSMAEAGYDESDEAMKQFEQLIHLFEKGLTHEQAVDFLKRYMPDVVLNNLRLEVELLKKMIDKRGLTPEEIRLVEEETDGSFWQNADLRLVKEQAKFFFNGY